MEAKHPFIPEISNTYSQVTSIFSSSEEQNILSLVFSKALSFLQCGIA